MKSIIQVNGTIPFDSFKNFSSNWVRVDDYNGININYELVGPGISGRIIIEASDDEQGNNTKYKEIYKFQCTTIQFNSITINAKFDYYRISVELQQGPDDPLTPETRHISMSAKLFNKVGKSSKCINHSGWYDVDDFNTLDLKIRHKITPATSDIQATIHYNTSVASAFRDNDVIFLKTTDSISGKLIDIKGIKMIYIGVEASNRPKIEIEGLLY